MKSQLSSDSTPPSGTKSSSRSFRACIWCRTHKRKCDGSEPCSTCSASTDPRRCEYAPPQKRGRKIKRPYADKLSIEHIPKKRQDPLETTYTEQPLLLPPLRVLDSKPPNEGGLSLAYSSPIELPPIIPRYPDSLTSPERYNFSSKYSSHSLPEIRIPPFHENDMDNYRLPQIRSMDDNSLSSFSRQQSFNLPNSNQALPVNTSTSIDSSEPLIESLSGWNQKSNSESDYLVQKQIISPPPPIHTLSHSYNILPYKEEFMDDEDIDKADSLSQSKIQNEKPINEKAEDNRKKGNPS